MKAAVIQINSGADKAQNVNQALEFIGEAVRKKSKFILLPEIFNYRGPAAVSAIAEGIPGESIWPLIKLAKEHGVYILAGSIFEKIAGQKKAYNTSVLIGPNGRIQAQYRKMNLFESLLGSVAIRESKNLLAGGKFTLSQVENFKVGLSICYDLRFGEIYREYSCRGAHILTVPSAFTRTTGEAHFEVLLRARAIENLCYVLAPNQFGEDARGVRSYGHSMIIDPWGRILARASGNKAEVIYADLKMDAVVKARKILPAVLKIRKEFP